MNKGRGWLWWMVALSFPLRADPALQPAGWAEEMAGHYGLGVAWHAPGGGRLDIGLNVDGRRVQPGSIGLTQLSLGPGLVYRSGERGLRPLAYAGVGPAWVSPGRLGSRDGEVRLQFNSRAGLGLVMGRHSLALEAWHLSTGGLKKPDDGLTSYGVSYRYRFD